MNFCRSSRRKCWIRSLLRLIRKLIITLIRCSILKSILVIVCHCTRRNLVLHRHVKFMCVIFCDRCHRLIWSLSRRVEARSLSLVCVVNGHSIPLNVLIRLIDQIFPESNLLHNLRVSVKAKCLALVVLSVSITKVCGRIFE